MAFKPKVTKIKARQVERHGKLSIKEKKPKENFIHFFIICDYIDKNPRDAKKKLKKKKLYGVFCFPLLK